MILSGLIKVPSTCLTHRTCLCICGLLTCMGLQVVLPEGMACERMQSAAGLQILSGELMVNERTVEQVRNCYCSPHLHSNGVQ